MDKGIDVTYDNLFEFLVREKSRAELQKLEQDFFNSIAEFLKEKKAALSRNKLDAFSEDEREKTEKQIRNFQKLLRELYEKREKKIVELAVIKARSSDAAIDTSAMLGSEKQLFGELAGMLTSFRDNVLARAANGEAQQASGAAEAKPTSDMMDGIEAPEVKDGKLVRFTHEVPRFIGKELEVYGPFNANDTATLPPEIADILISKGRAESISE